MRDARKRTEQVFLYQKKKPQNNNACLRDLAYESMQLNSSKQGVLIGHSRSNHANNYSKHTTFIKHANKNKTDPPNQMILGTSNNSL